MKIKLFIVVVTLLFDAVIYADYKIGDEITFTYNKEKIAGILKKVTKNKIYVGIDGCIIGYRQKNLSLEDRAKFYPDAQKEYDKILAERKKAEKEKAEKAAEVLEKSPYKYAGKSINPFQFEYLLFKSVDILYATTSGIVIDMLRDSSTARYKRFPCECQIGDRGYFSGRILQVLDRKILVSSYSQNTLYIYCVDNIDTRNMVGNREYSRDVIMKGVFKYTSTMGASQSVPLLEPLRAPTREELRKYFNSGKKLYYFEKIVTPATYKACGRCKGSGKILKGKGSLTYIECPRCGGRKKIKVSNKQISYKKVDIEYEPPGNQSKI